MAFDWKESPPASSRVCFLVKESEQTLHQCNRCFVFRRYFLEVRLSLAGSRFHLRDLTRVGVVFVVIYCGDLQRNYVAFHAQGFLLARGSGQEGQ